MKKEIKLDWYFTGGGEYSNSLKCKRGVEEQF